MFKSEIICDFCMRIVKMLNKIVLFMFVWCFISVIALTDEEGRAEFTKFVMGCVKTNPVDPGDLIDLQKLVVPKKKDAKCLLACAYRAEGTMNEKGLYDIDHAYKVAEIMKNGDEKRLENGKKIADICAKVNEAEVSDGEKGCQRAALIFECVITNSKKYGFKI